MQRTRVWSSNYPQLMGDKPVNGLNFRKSRESSGDFSAPIFKVPHKRRDKKGVHF